jgi:hypothetical protein
MPGANLFKNVLGGFRSAAESAGQAVNKLSVGGFHGTTAEKGWRGLEQIAKSTSSDSLVMMPITYVAEKALGKERVQNALWKGLSKPLQQADIGVGQVLEKLPFGKTLFRQTVKIPIGNPSKKVFKEIQHSSALAPLVKVKNIATPFIVAAGAEKGIRSLKEMRERAKNPQSPQQVQLKPVQMGKISMDKEALKKSLEDQNLREKVASTMVHLFNENKGHKKRAQAVQMLYKQAELGHAEVPRSYSEFTEKVASLMSQDLQVLDKALELLGGNEKLGSVDSAVDMNGPLTPSEKFQSDILSDEQFF